MSYNLLREAIRSREAREGGYEPTHEYMKCVTVTVGSSVEPADRPGYRWVQELNQPGSVIQVFGPNCPKIADLPVLVGYGPKPPMRLQILFVDLSIVAELPEYDGSPYLGPHAPDHAWPDFYPGHDPLTVYPRAWSQLRVNPTDPAGLSVEISPLTYPTAAGAATYGGGVEDLTSNVPGTGQARLVLVYLDVSTNTIGTSNGAVGPAADGWMLDEPTLPAKSIPSALVRLEYGQTTITESDIMDRRMFLNATTGMGWPFNTQAITVDTTDPAADVATIAEAIAVPAVAGNLILVSPETHACDGLALTSGVNMGGLDRDATILQTATSPVTLTIPDVSYVFDLTVKNTDDPAGWAIAVWLSGGDVELRDIVAIANNTNTGGSQGISIGSSVVTARLEDCDAVATAGTGSSYALYAAAGSGTVEIRGGKYDGDTADIYAGAGVTIILYGPTLVNSTFAGTGTIKGWYYDANGDHIPIDHSQLGDVIFNEDDGLLLLDFQRWEQHGSGAARANYIIGSRLERARVGAANAVAGSRGALHFEPGRWQSKRALVIEEGTTNRIDNPSFEVNIASGWLVHGANTGTNTHSDEQAKKGTHSLKQVAAADRPVMYYDISGDLTAGNAHAVTVWGYISAYTAGTPGVNIYYDAANHTFNFDTSKIGQWQKIEVTFTPVAAAGALLFLLDNVGNGTWTMYSDCVQLEEEACSTTYCDGDQGDGCSWAGVNHASRSSRTASYVLLDDCVGLVSANNTLSFRVLWQPLYDADAAWPEASARLWDIRGANANSQILLYFNSATNGLDVWINGAVRLSSAPLTFKAGDWVEPVVTADFTLDDYRLYVGAALEDIDATALAAPTMTDWVLGAAFNHASLYAAGAFAEYSVFDRVLTATEIAILFAEERGLVDCAAIENRPTVPGVSAGIWSLLSEAETPSDVAYAEVGEQYRITFAGLWVCGLVQFEVVASLRNAADNLDVKLQYYDTTSTAWRDVPNSELTFAVAPVARKRTPPLAIPEQEYEYRVMAEFTDGGGGGWANLFRVSLIVSPGGDYDNL